MVAALATAVAAAWPWSTTEKQRTCVSKPPSGEVRREMRPTIGSEPCSFLPKLQKPSSRLPLRQARLLSMRAHSLRARTCRAATALAALRTPPHVPDPPCACPGCLCTAAAAARAAAPDLTGPVATARSRPCSPGAWERAPHRMERKSGRLRPPCALPRPARAPGRSTGSNWAAHPLSFARQCTRRCDPHCARAGGQTVRAAVDGALRHRMVARGSAYKLERARHRTAGAEHHGVERRC